jgi:hypothetical protein
LLKRLAWCFTRTHDRKIKYRKWILREHVHITIAGSTQRRLKFDGGRGSFA